MTPEEAEPIDRLTEQRLRNRAIDVLEILAAGQEGAERVGANEWFNDFFDLFADEGPWGDWRTWSTFTEAELNGLGGVHFLMVMASETTGPFVDLEELEELRWPARVQPLARDVYRLMVERGHFSNDVEESEPSGS
jgi:hypothetical protein